MKSKLFKKWKIKFRAKINNSTPSGNWGKDVDHQIDVLNNLDLEDIGTRSRYNLSKMEQSELPKL